MTRCPYAETGRQLWIEGDRILCGPGDERRGWPTLCDSGCWEKIQKETK